MAYTLSSNEAEDLHRVKSTLRQRPSSLSALKRTRPASVADLSVSRFIHGDGTATMDVASLASMRRSSSRPNIGGSSHPKPADHLSGGSVPSSPAIPHYQLPLTPFAPPSTRHPQRSSSKTQVLAGRSVTKTPPVTALPSPAVSRQNTQSAESPNATSTSAKNAKKGKARAPALSSAAFIMTSSMMEHQPPESPAPDRAAMLARKYRLEFFEAKRLLKELDAFNARTDRWPSFDDFCELVRCAYELESTSHIKEVELKKGYKDVCLDGSMSDDSFLGWYMANLFSFPRTPEKNKEDEHGSDIFAVQHLRKTFYEISEGADHINFASFKRLLRALLHAKSEHDVCENRVKSVWKELELADGRVAFNDFMDWYVECLAEAKAGEQKPDLALAESFYKPFAPPGLLPRRKQFYDISRDYKAIALAAGA